MNKLVLVLLLSALAASASLLTLPDLLPGGVITNVDDTTDHTGINPLGGPVSDTGIQSFTMTGSGITTSGELRQLVMQEASGTLDFYIQVTVFEGTLSAITSINTGNFQGFDTRVGTVSPVALLSSTGSQFPQLETRSADGDTINWIFTRPITAGESATLAASTNALTDKPANIGLLGAGGATVTLNGFQPATFVPEPATYGLMAAGLLALAYKRWT